MAVVHRASTQTKDENLFWQSAWVYHVSARSDCKGRVGGQEEVLMSLVGWWWVGQVRSGLNLSWQQLPRRTRSCSVISRKWKPLSSENCSKGFFWGGINVAWIKLSRQQKSRQCDVPPIMSIISHNNTFADHQQLWKEFKLESTYLRQQEQQYTQDCWRKPLNVQMESVQNVPSSKTRVSKLFLSSFHNTYLP